MAPRRRDDDSLTIAPGIFRKWYAPTGVWLGTVSLDSFTLADGIHSKSIQLV
jgi:hypothetical protein